VKEFLESVSIWRRYGQKLVGTFLLSGWPLTWKTWKSGNLRVVREKSGKIGKVRE